MASDWELLKAWRGGDRGAGDALAQRYLRPIARFFRHKLASAEDDLVQRTFVACVEAAPRFEGRSSFRTFLYAIARNVLIEHLRTLRRDSDRERNEFDPSVSSLSALDPSPSQVLAGKESANALLAALRSVPLDTQLLLELYYWEDLSIAELAQVLDVPEGTVKGRLHRARQALLDCLSAEVPSKSAASDLEPETLFQNARSLFLERS